MKFSATGRGKTVTNSTKAITCTEKPGVFSTWKLYIEDTDLDQILGSARTDEDPDKAEIYSYPVDKNGFALEDISPVKVFNEKDILKDASDGAIDYTEPQIAYTAFYNGKPLDEWSALGRFFTTRKKDGKWDKLDANSVTIQLYKMTINRKENDGIVTYGKNKLSSLETETISIIDSQPELTIVKNDNHINSVNDDVILGNFDVYYIDDENPLTTNLAVDAAKGTKSVFVKTISYTENYDGADLVIDANVGYTLVVDD